MSRPSRAWGSVNSAVKAFGAMVLSRTSSPILLPAAWTAVASSDTSWPIALVAMVTVLPVAPASLISAFACSMFCSGDGSPSKAALRTSSGAVAQTALVVRELVAVPAPPRPALTKPPRSSAMDSARRTRTSPSAPFMLVTLTLTVLSPSPK